MARHVAGYTPPLLCGTPGQLCIAVHPRPQGALRLFCCNPCNEAPRTCTPAARSPAQTAHVVVGPFPRRQRCDTPAASQVLTPPPPCPTHASPAPVAPPPALPPHAQHTHTPRVAAPSPPCCSRRTGTQPPASAKMGLMVSKALTRLFGKKEMRILMVRVGAGRRSAGLWLEEEAA